MFVKRGQQDFSGRMHLVQILLPLRDNDGRPFADDTLRGIQEELCRRFGGATAYNRSPAEGIRRGGGEHRRDDVVIVEVMTGCLDRAWWSDFRLGLEKLLEQEEIVVRAQAIERL